MTFINVTTTQAEVVVTEATGAITAVTTASAPSLLTAVTEGPQGPPGPVVPLGSLSNVNTSAVADGSVLYYHEATSTFKADTLWTTNTLTDGGNF